MTSVEFFVDPSCPWAWVASRWLKQVAPVRDLDVVWRSYCLEIRDDYGVAPQIPEAMRERVIAAHARSHRMLRVFEAARAGGGEDAVDALYTEWGRRAFAHDSEHTRDLVTDTVVAAGLDDALVAAGADEKWDAPILEAMEVAYAFGGPKTQTPTIVIRGTTTHGFKGPVMAEVPAGDDALRLWDAIQVLSEQPGFYEITRPRARPPLTR